MNVVILGPQGSGKGTQAKLLAKEFGLNYFEMGQILRDIAQSSSPNAGIVREYLTSGRLVPDKVIREVLENFLNVADSGGIIFDGFPRNIKQYKLLKRFLAKNKKKIDKVINLVVSEKESIRRLSARRIDKKTGKVYNLLTSPPPKSVDPNNLVVRNDDRLPVIKERLKIYNTQTTRVILEAKKEGILEEVDGERPIDVIFEDIKSRLLN